MDKIEQVGNSGGIDGLDDAWLSLINSGSFYIKPEKPAPEPLDRNKELDDERRAGEAAPVPEPLILPPERPKAAPVPLGFGESREEKKLFGLRNEINGQVAEPAEETVVDGVSKSDAVDENNEVNENDEVEKNGEADLPEETMMQRQRKLVKLVVTGDPEVLKQKSVELSTDEVGEVIEAIKNGKLNDAKWINVLKKIERPVDKKSADVVHGEIADDSYVTEILARVSGVGLENTNKTTGDVVKRLAKNCDTSIAFESWVSLMIGDSKRRSEAEHKKYQEAAKKLERAVYGEQMDYWVAAQELIREAKNADF